jgi:hypothetical protein
MDAMTRWRLQLSDSDLDALDHYSLACSKLRQRWTDGRGASEPAVGPHHDHII